MLDYIFTFAFAGLIWLMVRWLWDELRGVDTSWRH